MNKDALGNELTEPPKPLDFNQTPRLIIKTFRLKVFETWNGFSYVSPSEQDFADPFLVHTTMYALGHYLQIIDLCMYAYWGIFYALKQIQVKHETAARAFCKLVVEVYVTREVEAKSVLRRLVAGFAAEKFEVLMRC